MELIRIWTFGLTDHLKNEKNESFLRDRTRQTYFNYESLVVAYINLAATYFLTRICGFFYLVFDPLTPHELYQDQINISVEIKQS